MTPRLATHPQSCRTDSRSAEDLRVPDPCTVHKSLATKAVGSTGGNANSGIAASSRFLDSIHLRVLYGGVARCPKSQAARFNELTP